MSIHFCFGTDQAIVEKGEAIISAQMCVFVPMI